MEWSKLKNVVLLILLVTNLFLLGLLGMRSWTSTQSDSAAREDVLLLLSRSGISMEPEVFPKDAVLSHATVSRDRAGEAALLAPLLGTISSEEALGGGQYLYTGPNGTARLQSRGEFSISLSPGAYPLSGDPGTHAAETLSLLGFEGLLLSVKETGDTLQLTYLQLWDEIPVISCRVEVLYEAGSLLSLTGTRLSGAPAAGDPAELSAVNGALRFLEQLTTAGDVCSRISLMHAGYRLSTGPSDPAALVPVWYFVTDTGSYILDAATYQLTRL